MACQDQTHATYLIKQQPQLHEGDGSLNEGSFNVLVVTEHHKIFIGTSKDTVSLPSGK